MWFLFQAKSTVGEATPLSLQNVGGVFLVLGIGTLMGLLGTLLELVGHIFKRSKVEKFNFKEEMKSEIDFFMKFRNNVKPTRKSEGSEPRESVDNRMYLEKLNKTI